MASVSQESLMQRLTLSIHLIIIWIGNQFTLLGTVSCIGPTFTAADRFQWSSVSNADSLTVRILDPIPLLRVQDMVEMDGLTFLSPLLMKSRTRNDSKLSVLSSSKFTRLFGDQSIQTLETIPRKIHSAV